MRFRAAILALPVVLSTPAAADTVDINLNNDAFRLMYGRDLTGAAYGNPQIDLGYLYNEDRRSNLFHLGLNTSGFPTGMTEAALGARVYYGDLRRDIEVGGLAIGGMARLFLSTTQQGPALSINGHIAPRVVSFADADRLYEIGARAEYHIMPAGAVYAGLRRIRTKLDNGGSITIDSGAYIGVQFWF